MDTTPPYFRAALLCDDIRTEQDGKYIAIGIYGTYLSVDEFPSTINYRILGIVRTTESGSFATKIRICDGQGQVFGRGTVTMQVAKPAAGDPVSLPAGSATFEKPGRLILQEEVGDSWVDIEIWEVIPNDLSSRPTEDAT